MVAGGKPLGARGDAQDIGSGCRPWPGPMPAVDQRFRSSDGSKPSATAFPMSREVQVLVEIDELLALRVADYRIGGG